MKGSRLYLLFLLTFLIIVFIIQLSAPHKFVWKPTFDKYDKEPFGSYVFDDVLSSSIDDYSVIDKTFYQIFQEDSVSEGRAFLLTERRPGLSEIDIEMLYKIIHLGNQVMICSENFSYWLEDTLHINTSFDNYMAFNVNNITDNKVRDSIFFGTDTLNPIKIFEVFPQVHPVFLIPDTSKCCHDSIEVLVWDHHYKPLVVRAFLGKGELFLVSTPLMFTNFGLLDGDNASYAFQLLSYMKDKPLMRIEAYGIHSEKPQTPLRYILSEMPLRWATYTGMALLLLFMAFTVKRRQRVIPMLKTNPNRSLGFIQLISNLYYQKHDNFEILKMKYKFFCADVKNLIGVELYDQVPCESDYDRLNEKTGMEKDFINRLLQNIRYAIYTDRVVDLQLKQYIDGMNEILRSLKS